MLCDRTSMLHTLHYTEHVSLISCILPGTQALPAKSRRGYGDVDGLGVSPELQVLSGILSQDCMFPR